MSPILRRSPRCFLPFWLCFCLLAVAGRSFAQDLDSMLRVLPGHPNDSNKIKLLENIIYIYSYKDPSRKSTLPYIEMMQEIAAGIHYPRGEASASLSYADYLFVTGHPEESILYMKKADSIYTKIDYTFGLAGVNSHYGSYHRSRGEYEKALERYQKTYDLYEKIGEKRGQALTLGTMALLFLNLERYEEGENYYLRSLEIREEIGDRRGMSHALLNLGVLNNDLKRYDKALTYFNLCLQIQKDLKDLMIIAGCQINMGNIYVARGEYDKALKTFKDSYDNFLQLGDSLKMAYSLMYQCTVYRSTGRYNEALQALNEGFGLIRDRKIAAASDLANFHMEYYNTYKAMGNYRQALASYELANEYQSGIFSSDMAGKISELKEKYETGKKEQENETLKKNGEIQELQLKQRLYFLYGIGGLALLIIVISALLIRNNRIRSEQHTMRLEQRLLRSQMNPHFIFNALTAIQSFMMKNNPAEAGRFLSSFARIVRSILENSREEYISLSREVQWLQNYISLQELRFDNGFDYTLHVDEELDLENTWIPPMLTQPFIENALEHGFRDMEGRGELSVSFREQDGFLQVDVQDNGVGFDQDGGKEQTHGKKSLALQITRERLELLNRGKRRKIHFTIRSAAGSGTLVSFRIPLKKKF